MKYLLYGILDSTEIRSSRVFYESSERSNLWGPVYPYIWAHFDSILDCGPDPYEDLVGGPHY